MTIADQIANGVRQIVTYPIFVGTMAILTTIGIAALSGSHWMSLADITVVQKEVEKVAKDVQATNRLADDRWATHIRNEAARDAVIQNKLETIEIKLDKLRDMIRP